MDVTAASSRDVDGKFFLIFVSFVSCCRTHVLSVTPPLLLTRSCRPVQWQQELKASTGAVDRHRHHHSKPQRRGRKVLFDCCVFSIMLPHTRSVLHPLSSRPPGAAGRCSSNGQDITLSDIARLSAKVRPPGKLLPRWWELRPGAVSIRATGRAGRQPWCVRQQTGEITAAAAGAARRFHDSNSRRLGWPPAVVRLRQELQVCTAEAWDFSA